MKSTFLATSNIALVKYWGKRDTRFNLPTNGSISATMDEQLKTVTTVEFSPKLKADEATLEGKPLQGRDLQRISDHLNIFRHAAASAQKAKIVSENSFPSSAGFASSASGYAALTLAAAKAIGLKTGMAELSTMARRGSGSACRSMFGGFVEWKKGTREEGLDSLALQLHPATHWKDFRNVIATVRKEPKKVSSRKGMMRTTQTSRLFQKRLEAMPYTLQEMREALKEKDLGRVLTIAMRESNQMHATMLDTFPPLAYLNDASLAVIHEVHAFNDAAGETLCGYTFDAGPNPHVLTNERNSRAVQAMLAQVEGVESVRVCRLGDGPKELKKHLF